MPTVLVSLLMFFMRIFRTTTAYGFRTTTALYNDVNATRAVIGRCP